MARGEWWKGAAKAVASGFASLNQPEGPREGQYGGVAPPNEERARRQAEPEFQQIDTALTDELNRINELWGRQVNVIDDMIGSLMTQRDRESVSRGRGVSRDVGGRGFTGNALAQALAEAERNLNAETSEEWRRLQLRKPTASDLAASESGASSTADRAKKDVITSILDRMTDRYASAAGRWQSGLDQAEDDRTDKLNFRAQELAEAAEKGGGLFGTVGRFFTGEKDPYEEALARSY